MKTNDRIINVIGLLLIILSIYFFYINIISFTEGTTIGLTGLVLYVLKGSAIRRYIQELLTKFLNK